MASAYNNTSFTPCPALFMALPTMGWYQFLADKLLLSSIMTPQLKLEMPSHASIIEIALKSLHKERNLISID
jgi:hypothetical protein